MTFRITPKPPKGTGAYQQAVDLKRTLEAGGWAASLTPRGKSPEYPLMSVIWAVAYQANGGVTKLEYDDHEIVFSYPRDARLLISVDGFAISWNRIHLGIMLLDEEVTS